MHVCVYICVCVYIYIKLLKEKKLSGYSETLKSLLDHIVDLVLYFIIISSFALLPCKLIYRNLGFWISNPTTKTI